MSHIFICPLTIQFICIINNNMLRNLNVNGRGWMKICLEIYGLLLLLSYLFLVTFPRNTAQIVRRYRSTSVWKILFDYFCIFGVMTNFVVEKEFLDPRRYPEGSYKIGSVRPSVRPSIRLSGRFLWIVSLTF